jgi:hypothetical protein
MEDDDSGVALSALGAAGGVTAAAGVVAYT